MWWYWLKLYIRYIVSACFIAHHTSILFLIAGTSNCVFMRFNRKFEYDWRFSMDFLFFLPHQRKYANFGMVYTLDELCKMNGWDHQSGPWWTQKHLSCRDPVFLRLGATNDNNPSWAWPEEPLPTGFSIGCDLGASCKFISYNNRIRKGFHLNIHHDHCHGRLDLHKVYFPMHSACHQDIDM